MNTSLFHIIGCLVLSFLTPILRAQTPSETLDAYQHLYEVNKEWKHFKIAAPAQKINFTNDTKRIRFHLETVIDHLSKLVPINSSVEAQEKRSLLLAELKTYAAQEIFPQNIYHKNRQPYFIDHKGTHCAVGYLMKVSGAGDLAVQISKEHNYDYLPNIETEGVLNWAEEQGFSLNELALIQPGYSANEPVEELGKGANGSVNTMFQTWDKLYLAGEFTLLDSLPCLNVGVYEMGQLSCLGNGVDGKVNDISYVYNRQEVLVVGDLIDGGIHYPLATYHAVNGWTFHSIPGRSNAEGLHAVESNTLEVAIKDASIAGTEIWEESNGTWKKQYTFNGVVFDIKQNWYVGVFNSLIHHRSGMPDTLIYSHNAVEFDYIGNVAHSFSANNTSMPDTIQVVETSGAVTYFGGYGGGYSAPCVTRFLNNTLQPLIFQYNFWSWGISNETKILDLKADPVSGNLYIAGDINYTPLNGTYWTSVGEYQVGTGFLQGYNNFDSSVTSMAVFEGELIIGGPFSQTGRFGIFNPLNHLAKFTTATAVSMVEGALTLKVFPNPTTNDVTIDLGNDYVDASIELSNTLGQVIHQEEYFSVNTINLSLEGVSGIYLVKVKTEDAESIVKVIKQ
jgi:hypothetical protein